MPFSQEELAKLKNSQAWRFAGLVQERLTHPVEEKVIAVPASQEWHCGVFTFIAPNGQQVRMLNGVDQGGETCIDFSQDGGNTWVRAAVITKEDESIDIRPIIAVERPYMYGKTVDGEPWVVFGTAAAEKGTKSWDIREREAPLAHLEKLKDAYVRMAFPANAEYAYKDGVPIQPPEGDDGIYLSVTRHHIAGSPRSAVNADAILCQGDKKTGRYEIKGLLLPRASRGGIDNTCNRLTCEIVFPDATRFWGCDIRNGEDPNEASRSPLKPGDISSWRLGDFDEISSFAIGMWPKDAPFPKTTSVNAVLGWSSHPSYPALRWLGTALLISPIELAELVIVPPDSSQDNDPAVLLTYEKAAATGAKSTFQQSISKKELADAMAGKGPALLVGLDPSQVTEQQRYQRSW